MDSTTQDLMRHLFARMSKHLEVALDAAMAGQSETIDDARAVDLYASIDARVSNAQVIAAAIKAIAEPRDDSQI
ncbi:hypothetical protein [Pyruvatibacter sp.]